MNKGYICFETNDGRIVDHHDIINTAKIASGRDINPDDFETIREYAKGCKGIKNEVENPSVEYLLQHGEKVRAIKLYYRLHDGIEPKKAKEIVEQIEREMLIGGK